MARSPARQRNVYFLGAGFSKAFGLPNTAELLSEVHALSDSSSHWGVSRNIPSRLESAYRYFYPEEGKNFRPPVGDFFMVLATYTEVAGAGLPQGFPDNNLLDDLKFAIASILCTRTKVVDNQLAESHEYLDEVLNPGNIAITSNWDLSLERACIRREIPYRLRWYEDSSSVTILKLHGSIDWTKKEDRKEHWSTSSFYRLEDLINSRPRHDPLSDREVARCHATENWTRAYQRIKATTNRPYMLTMARGKANNILPLTGIWSDAYNVLSRARVLKIIGYSMPEDDVEIRTLLRAGVKRGNSYPVVSIVNPAPDVHVRIRQQIHNRINSDYAAVQGLG